MQCAFHRNHRIVVFLIFGVTVIASPAGSNAQGPSPSPRWGHVFVYDPDSDTVLLYGGAAERGAYLDDTWTWDGSAWTQHEVPGPSARGFAAAAYDPGRQAIVIHGGRAADNETQRDTWQWDGDGWSDLDAGADFAADHHEMVFDTVNARLIAFGGWNSESQNVQGETWQLQGESWVRLQVGEESPSPRAAFGMTWNSARETVVLYGGLWVEGQYADLWEFADGHWRSLGGPHERSSLDHHDMFFHAVDGRVMLFGGKNYRRVMQQRTLALHGDQWEVLAESGPSPRHSYGVTYDSRRGRVLLFGGKRYEGQEQFPLGDLWQFDETWRLIADPDAAP